VQDVLLAVHNMTAKEGSLYGTHDRVRRAAREPGCDARRQKQRIAQVKPNKASPIHAAIIVRTVKVYLPPHCSPGILGGDSAPGEPFQRA